MKMIGAHHVPHITEIAGHVQITSHQHRLPPPQTRLHDLPRKVGRGKTRVLTGADMVEGPRHEHAKAPVWLH
jgi:hypothetical protein